MLGNFGDDSFNGIYFNSSHQCVLKIICLGGEMFMICPN